ncbi:peptidoglycan-binding domain-containing protein [Xylanivirga thermophila]|uniref:peptidoglycan-binding domain-containing protein n=1 Tax=Xylanivirga thermophila TaxID=2496273 RepID=UPI00101C10D4|nr:peptidoglycan-binding protein [Xylanivirga thermophila]
MISFDKQKCAKTVISLGISSMLLLSNTAFAAPLLKVGSRGNEVATLQQQLQKMNLFNYNRITGYYGNITKDAVIRFQKQHGLSPDGIVGKNTYNALSTYDNAKRSGSTSQGVLIRRGSRGGAVSELQQILKSKGYLNDKVDGIFGRNTENAVKSFQKSSGLKSDGIVGKATWAKLGSNNIPASGSTSSNTLIRRGSRGGAVSELQQILKSKGYLNDKVDGIFGRNTENAVKSFQKSSGLKSDGIVGKATWAKLKSNTSSSNSRGNDRNNSAVVMLNWSQVNSIFPRKANARVIDVDTGLSFNIHRYGGTLHADVEPVTAKDTAIMKKAYGGSWSWSRRAVIVEVGGRRIAGSMNGMPHGGQDIRSNNFDGQFCIHFLGSRTHGSDRVDAAHQNMIKKASLSR